MYSDVILKFKIEIWKKLIRMYSKKINLEILN